MNLWEIKFNPQQNILNKRRTRHSSKELIHPLIVHLMSGCHMPGTVLGLAVRTRIN